MRFSRKSEALEALATIDHSDYSLCGLEGEYWGRCVTFSFTLNRDWPRLPFTARIERSLFHRKGSASKKGISPLPSRFQAPLIISSGLGAD